MAKIKQVTEQTEERWHHVATVEDLGGLKRKVVITYDVEGLRDLEEERHQNSWWKGLTQKILNNLL
jgi:hypothetical protein